MFIFLFVICLYLYTLASELEYNRMTYYKSSIVCNNSLFGLTQITFHFVSISHTKGNENTFILLVFSASKDFSAVSLPTEDPPIN